MGFLVGDSNRKPGFRSSSILFGWQPLPAPEITRAHIIALALLPLVLTACGATAPPTAGVAPRLDEGVGTVVNDVHSQLNLTHVDRIVAPRSVEEIQETIRQSRKEGKSISIAGARHAMGGQQSGEGAVLIDMSKMNRVLRFDRTTGLVEAEAGIEWPGLVDYLVAAQKDVGRAWGIRQKQTGADRLSLGGGLSANAHGRGLRLKPIVQDVEDFTLVDSGAQVRRCSRRENPELFRLAIGGYGLFGVIARVTLRLAPRQKVERVVEVLDLKNLMPAFDKRIAEGYLYGDFQYAIDPVSPDFLKRGVFSCYRPVAASTPIAEGQKELSAENWKELYYLAHTDKTRAFEMYARYYLSTSGQVYWSDTHQMGVYIENYHEDLDRRLGSTDKGSEMITEVYVPRGDLTAFMGEARDFFRAEGFGPIYGTIRLIEKDDETFLAWAKERYACVIFNLHVVRTPQGIERAAARFRRLIDLAIGHGGSYFLTSHRWATAKQITTCYPQFPAFLRLKKKYDSSEIFQSDWYRQYRSLADGAP